MLHRVSNVQHRDHNTIPTRVPDMFQYISKTFSRQGFAAAYDNVFPVDASQTPLCALDLATAGDLIWSIPGTILSFQ